MMTNKYGITTEKEDKLREVFEELDNQFHHNQFNVRSPAGYYMDSAKEDRWIGFMMANSGERK